MPTNDGDSPRAVLLAPRWNRKDEACWGTRQVAGAIACAAQVHVVTTQGSTARTFDDGVFVVHELATADPVKEARRELAQAALASAVVGGRRSPGPSEACDGVDEAGVSEARVSEARVSEAGVSEAGRLYSQLTDSLGDPWSSVSLQLRELHPDFVVLADYRQIGAVRALDDSCPDVPVVLLPLSRELDRVSARLFADVLDRSCCSLAFTETERRVFGVSRDDGWARFIGLPMSANSSLLREPNAHTGDTGYLLVLSPHPIEGEGSEPLAHLVRTRFASTRVAIAASDAFVVCVDGVPLHTLAALDRRSDLLRLMAWARVTVDLRPGSLFGRHSLESLLYGTPIVVPASSAAREHAETGSAGLWFGGSAELIWSLEALGEPGVAEVLGEQGRRYTDERYGSTPAFITRTLAAIGELGRISFGPVPAWETSGDLDKV
jgi:hypothetical protein